MIRTLLIFLIGFYVTQVVSRYWDQFMSLPWPDRIAFKLVSNIPGTVSMISLYTLKSSKICNFLEVALFAQMLPKMIVFRIYLMSDR